MNACTEASSPPAATDARTPRKGLPVFAVTMKPLHAPLIMHPSMPRLMMPARSEITSPYVASITDEPARTAPVPTSVTKLIASLLP